MFAEHLVGMGHIDEDSQDGRGPSQHSDRSAHHFRSLSQNLHPVLLHDLNFRYLKIENLSTFIFLKDST